MSEGVKKLKEIGAQKIHEVTHISKHYVQAMLHESFEDMNRIQFLGFISILEKEYGVKLEYLREKGDEYFKETPPPENNNHFFITQKKKKSYSFFYIIVALLIFIAVTAYTITTFSSEATDKKVEILDNSNIDNATKNIIDPIDEVDFSVDELNSSIEDENLSLAEELPPVEVTLAPKSLKIIPNIKLWLGYIDLKSYKKYQKTLTDELVLDPQKDWLLVCGHGDLNIEVNSEIEEFKTKKNLRFSYIDGVLKMLTYSEFKELNRGKEW